MSNESNESNQHDPVRWVEPDSDCDPELRRVLERVQGELPQAWHAQALTQAIERAAQDQAAVGGGKPLRERPALGLGFGLSGIGIAALAVYFATLSGAAPSRSAGSAQPARPSAVRPAASESRAHDVTASRANEPADDIAAARTTDPSDDVPAARTTDPSDDIAAPMSAKAKDWEPRLADKAAARPPAAPATTRDAAQDAPAAGTRRKAATPSRTAEQPITADLPRASAAARASAATRGPGADHPGSEAPVQTAVPPELELLSAAQRMLRVSAAEALALAEQHARAYPSGQFSTEREEIAIAALVALGDSARARARAEAFLERYPGSLAATRIRRLLSSLR